MKSNFDLWINLGEHCPTEHLSSGVDKIELWRTNKITTVLKVIRADVHIDAFSGRALRNREHAARKQFYLGVDSDRLGGMKYSNQAVDRTQ